MSHGDVRNRTISAQNFFSAVSSKVIEGTVNDRARKDLKKDIFYLQCELAEEQGHSGWNEVAHYILDEDPRV